VATETKNVRISLIFKGEYDPSISYVPLDVVTWHNNVYICGVAVKGIAPDKYSGSSWWAYGAAYWLQSFLNFRAISLSDNANGFNYLQMFTQGNSLYTIITRSPYINDVGTQCSKIF
jgi:hypothetical protein